VSFDASNLLPHMIAPHTIRLVTLLTCYKGSLEWAIEEAFGGSHHVGLHTGVVVIKKGSDRVFRMGTVMERPLSIDLPACPACGGNTKGHKKDERRYQIICVNSSCRTKAKVDAQQGESYGSFPALRKDLITWRWVNGDTSCWDQIRLPWEIHGNEARVFAVNRSETRRDSKGTSTVSVVKEQDVSGDIMKRALEVVVATMGEMHEELCAAKNKLDYYGIELELSDVYNHTLKRLQELGLSN
jgi:hypothetical protein